MKLFANTPKKRRTAITTKERHGPDFYKKIGKKGGQKSRGGGFVKGSEQAKEAGRKGGRISRGGGRKPRSYPE